MEFAILGPVEVRHAGEVLALGGRKQRAVLAMLLLRPNQIVSRDHLIEGLWGEHASATAARTVESYVSRLRRLLGPDRVERRAPGYVVRVEHGELDLERFEALTEKGRAAARSGDPARASQLLRDALAVWRGAALADLLHEPFAAVEGERLEERRLVATEERIDLDLALGSGAELVSELEGLVRENPYREGLVGQLMLALYRGGRQRDALATFRAARHRLSDELGLEPGPELQHLQRQILEHDPAIRTPPPVYAATSAPRSSRRFRLTTAGIAAVLAVLGVGIGVVLGTNRTSASPSAVATNQVVRVASGSAREGVRLDGTPTAIAALDGSLWVADPSSDAVTRIDLEHGSVVDRIRVTNPGALAVGGGSVWVAGVPGDSITRIDPETGTVTQTIQLGRARATALTFDRGLLWVADGAGNALIAFASSSGTIRRLLPLDVRPTALATGKGAIWAADYGAAEIAQVDRRTGRTIATIRVGNGPAALALGHGAVWVANSLDATMSRVDPTTSTVNATIPVASSPYAVAIVGESVWVASEYDGSVSRIDTTRNVVVETIPLGGRSTALAVSGGDVWAGVRPFRQNRGGTLTLLHARPITIDPALHGDLLPPVSDGLTRDSLVTFNQVAGLAGTRLVPNLALTIPAPTDAGRTYTFRLRPDILYSDGRPVRAADFRRALERVFNLRSYGRHSFTSLLGAEECMADRASACDLSRAIVTDERTRTVTFHLRTADPAFLTNLTIAGLATPVPDGTPLRGLAEAPIPGTGPYMIASANDREIRYVRNPHFREWSHAAKPDGNPDEIVMRVVPAAEQRVRQVRNERADWTELTPGPFLVELSRLYPGQLHSSALPVTAFFRLNAAVPPFDDVRVRRALNYAVDRGAIVDLLGGDIAATPTCQVLPPGVRGYRRYCPYTRGVQRDGGWTAPDVERARGLVAASGTSGARVLLFAVTDHPTLGPRVSETLAATLRRLGYRTRICRVRSSLSATPGGCDSRRVHLRPTAWGGGFAHDFFGPLFSCRGSENAGFCDPGVDARMRRAQRLEDAENTAATRLWEQIDRDIVDQAGLVALASVRVIDFVSPRGRNYQFHPYWGVLASQLSVE